MIETGIASAQCIERGGCVHREMTPSNAQSLAPTSSSDAYRLIATHILKAQRLTPFSQVIVRDAQNGSSL
jgi:hypothetical protein